MNRNNNYQNLHNFFVMVVKIIKVSEYVNEFLIIDKSRLDLIVYNKVAIIVTIVIVIRDFLRLVLCK